MKRFKKALLAYFVYYSHRLLSMTWRYDITGDEKTLALLKDEQNFVYAHLHQQDWVIMAVWRNKQMNVLISLSTDGNAMARVAEKNGFLVTRGSSSKGGAMGLLKLVRNLKKQDYQQPTSLAIDGPRGPFGIPKKGVLTLSKAMKKPLILIAVNTDRYWEFSKAWSRTQVPKPFSRICLRYTQIPTDDLAVASNEDWEVLSQRITDELCYFLNKGKPAN